MFENITLIAALVGIVATIVLTLIVFGRRSQLRAKLSQMKMDLETESKKEGGNLAR